MSSPQPQSDGRQRREGVVARVYYDIVESVTESGDHYVVLGRVRTWTS